MDEAGEVPTTPLAATTIVWSLNSANEEELFRCCSISLGGGDATANCGSPHRTVETTTVRLA